MTPFRVFEEGNHRDAVVAIHGWITEPVVGELANVVARNGASVRIDLSQLAGADQAGLDALRRLREIGVPFSGVTPYIELLLDPRK